MNMKTMRSKEEITRDIDQNRRALRFNLRQTKQTLVERNPAVLMWRQAKHKWWRTRNRTLSKAKKTDEAIRSHLYQTIGCAMAAGMIAGFFLLRKKRLN